MITLTDHQNHAYNEIVDFIGNDERFMVLTGYAGTGKSTVVTKIVNNYEEIREMYKLVGTDIPRSISATATTNKAADHLQQTIGIDCTTLHSAMALTLDYYTKKLKIRTRNSWNNLGFVIVDEASMVDTELMDFIYQVAETTNAKFLFVGDPTQLPPVGEDFSLAFESGFKTVALTEIIRQPEGALRELCEDLRKQVLGTPITGVNIDGIEICHVDKETYNNLILEDMLRPDWIATKSKALAFTNKAVAEINKMVKTKLTGTHKIQKFDYVINNKYFNGGNKECQMKTDQMVYVSQVEHDVTYKDILGCKVTVNHKFDVFVPYKMAQMNKYIKTLTVEEALVVERNVADLRPLYASTVHKSQGSTYETVYVDIGNLATVLRFDQDLFHRLLYVATSRASVKVIYTGDV